MGRLTGGILVLVFATLAATAVFLVSGSSWYSDLPRLGQAAAILGIVAVAGGVFTLPVAFAFDAAARRIRQHLDLVSQGQVPTEAPAVGRPFVALTRAFCAAADAGRQRELQLSDALRDLKVRYRIVESEREQLRGVLHTLRDAVIVSDAFDEVISLNRAAAEILRFSGALESRQPLDRLVSDKRLCQMIRETREAGAIGESRVVEYDVSRGGQSVGYQVMLSCLGNSKGELGAVVTILHDLSREREIAQMKSDFVSKASHELRTPLSSIRAYVEMLVDGEATDEDSRREFYTIMQNETERLSRLIDNMLNISRIEAGIVQIDRESVDFQSMIRRAAESLGPQAAEKDITLNVKTAPVDLTAEGDSDMLYQVVLNLVSNAIKYTPNGGRVTVSADTDNLTRSVVVTVADTGLGIPPDALPRLFEKFFRIENFKRVAKGTGLGLNLCKHIVETVHQGVIGVESKLGMGSKFWFSVPMRYAGAKAA